jgi:hypothetical protein
MRWLAARSAPRAQRPVMPSEEGFLAFAGRDAPVPLREAFVQFRDLVAADMDWVSSRKDRFRLSASRVKIAALALTGLSTVILGIQAIPARASIALPLVAIVTILGALETFFNWRSRWVLMEESQYRLNRLRDEMDYYIVTTPPEELDRVRLDEFFAAQQTIWGDVSRRWIEFRKLDGGGAGHTSARLPGDSA